MSGVTAPSRPLTVAARGPLRGAVAAPASKSVTNRLLVVAALADGATVLHDPLDSDDSAAMRAAVAALGVAVDVAPGRWTVRGTGGHLVVPDAPLDARLSGTTMRFVAALATLAPGPVTVTGQPPLLRRPVGPLVGALRVLGAGIADEGGYPPVRAAGGGLDGGEVEVDVGRSSQFASALLLVAPYARSEVKLRLRGEAADGYIRLTAGVMAERGADVGEAERSWCVRPGRYRGGEVTVEYDASAAAHLFALAMATGGAVTVTNARTGTLQPDAGLIEVLRAMGGVVRREGAALTVEGPPDLAPVDVDLSRMPDQVTTIAVLAALAQGRSVLRGVGVARTHETDRLAALTTELGKLGVLVEEGRDRLRIHGGRPRGPARLDTYDDHRLAMAFTALGAAVGGVVIADPGCVAKTYPRFWEDARRLGVEWSEEPAR